ncbi:MAG: prepilin peptidase [Aliidongia sp.]
MAITLLAVAIAIYMIVAAQDLRQRRVSNLLCVGIALLGVVRWAVLSEPAPAAWALLAAITLFAIGIGLFALGWLGGGDVKLISATALLIGGPDTPRFLFIMSLIGSALALALLIHLKFERFNRVTSPTLTGPPPPTSDHAKVPYAVAVALAASIVLFLQYQHV